MSDEEADIYKSCAGGGKLRLKGVEFKKSKKKKSKKEKKQHKRSRDDEEDEEKLESAREVRRREEEASTGAADVSDEEEENPEDRLTDAQKRYMKVQRDRAAETARKEVQMTHRMKVEMYNDRLAALTEHNDIPRVSAAGNG
eukprot:CAMPEP_0171633474 /NCGR_PEP_ID=MMETSP0990-20121206/25222_1 /TAXON_ID=483369 /ORGANISM="non described non described, Strain CCMP2098" /LENGTH=141 /DNA_ID=CAMNT_0012204193 /DNA_START=28 /DNA_END=453 /DNA_ORIENTATION=+